MKLTLFATLIISLTSLSTFVQALDQSPEAIQARKAGSKWADAHTPHDYFPTEQACKDECKEWFDNFRRLQGALNWSCTKSQSKTNQYICNTTYPPSALEPRRSGHGGWR